MAPPPSIGGGADAPPTSRWSSSGSWHRSNAICWLIRPAFTCDGERHVHRLHPVAAARLHRRVDLVDLALADQVADGRRGDQHLAPRPRGPCRPVVWSSCWVTTPCSVRGQLHPDLLLLVRREHVDDAVDRLRRVLRVQGGEHQVAGLGRGDRGRDRLEVTHLTDQDDVGVLAQDVLQGLGRTRGCRRRPRAGSRCTSCAGAGTRSGPRRS